MASIRKRVLFSGLAVASIAALLTACSTPPSTTQEAASSSYLPCVIADVGGWNDRSFNQLSLAGVEQATKTIGSSYRKYESKNADDYDTGIASLIGEKCDIIVAPGFNFIASVKSAAEQNPKVNFAIVDDNSIEAPNVRDVVFATDQAAFLGGYAAAAYSKTGVVATWGGGEIPPVTLYMDGFVDGVKYYNEQNGKDVKALGWNVETQKGTFVGNFTDQNSAKSITQNFLDQDADVIVPVAASLYQGAAAAIRGSGSDAVIVGVDADLYKTDSKNKGLVLTSIQKQVGVAAKTAVLDAAKGAAFDNTTFVGTLKNGGVGLAPFHDYESKVPASLAGDLKEIQAGIEDGSIKVDSPASFTN
jgi:basic membrane protein A and related proteins